MMLKEDKLIKLINKRKELIKSFVELGDDMDISTTFDLVYYLEMNVIDIDELLKEEIRNENN